MSRSRCCLGLDLGCDSSCLGGRGSVCLDGRDSICLGGRGSVFGFSGSSSSCQDR